MYSPFSTVSYTHLQRTFSALKLADDGDRHLAVFELLTQGAHPGQLMAGDLIGSEKLLGVP